MTWFFLDGINTEISGFPHSKLAFLRWVGSISSGEDRRERNWSSQERGNSANRRPSDQTATSALPRVPLNLLLLPQPVPLQTPESHKPIPSNKYFSVCVRACVCSTVSVYA